MGVYVRMYVMAGEYEPAVRFGHVAAAVEDKVYVWGGGGLYAVSHDGPDKTDIILKVDILDVKVRNTLIFNVTGYREVQGVVWNKTFSFFFFCQYASYNFRNYCF